MGGGGDETHPSAMCWCTCRGRRGGNQDYCLVTPRYRSLRCEARRRIRCPEQPSCDDISDALVSTVRLDSPKRRPQPVPRRHLGNDLDLAVLDRLLPLGVEARRAHGVDGVAERVAAAEHAVRGVGVRAGAVGGEVDGIAVEDLGVGDGGGFIGQGGNDVETLGVDEGVLGVRGRPVEGACSETVELDFVIPDARVESFEALIKN
jgi:hypothetical protein